MSLKRVFSGRKVHLILLSIIIVTSVTLVSFSDKDFKIAKNLDIFATLFREVNLYYVDDTDPEKLVENGIKGMLKELDPYTTFIPESDMDEFKFMTTGQYGGIGALIRKAGDYTMISEPYEGFPAQRNGLQAGDTILSIDDISTKGKDISGVSELLKGKPNTPLKMRLKRLGVDSAFTIGFNREKVTINNVQYYGIIGDNVGYILLGTFTKGASKEVEAAYKELIGKGIKGIVLDLRNNTGGLLDEAVDIANIWLPRDTEIVSTRGKVKQWDKKYITENQPIDTSMPMVVLVNRASASASEIVCGSLQDLDRAVLVGQRTFGKGLVQTTRPLSYNTHLKITTAKYYIPSGRCIQALDYTHRNDDGSVGYIPDSLKSEFKTKNGRSVFDGGGVDPDIKVVSELAQNVSIALYTSNTIFDFATNYASKTKSIASPTEFVLSDELYNEFVDYAMTREIDYHTRSNDKYKELIKTAKREGYYDIAKDEFEKLEAKLKVDLRKDMTDFSDEIRQLLTEEIVSRYHYQKGRVISTLDEDKEILKAIEVINEKGKIASVLNPSKFQETKVAMNK
ncbi:MAG: S41 family peptidase [Bacteroidales bacterium]|nr:S41 family peptidase [Bacteroidales bacterium]